LTHDDSDKKDCKHNRQDDWIDHSIAATPRPLILPSTTPYKTSLFMILKTSLGEDDKLVEELCAREASTYPSRPQQVDLRTNIKLNGIMSEEIVKMHQSVSSFKPTIWLSADRWKMNTWYDMSGNANNMSEHNAITKRKNAAGSWGATQNSIALIR
jgi:hypothetical protein